MEEYRAKTTKITVQILTDSTVCMRYEAAVRFSACPLAPHLVVGGGSDGGVVKGGMDYIWLTNLFIFFSGGGGGGLVVGTKEGSSPPQGCAT